MVRRSVLQSSQRVWLAAQRDKFVGMERPRMSFDQTLNRYSDCIPNWRFEVLEVLKVSPFNGNDRFETNSIDSIYIICTLESASYSIQCQCWGYGLEWTLSIRELICDSDQCMMTECNELVLVGWDRLEIGWNQKSHRCSVRAYQTDDSKCLKYCCIVMEHRMGSCFEVNMSDLSSNHLTWAQHVAQYEINTGYTQSSL